MEVLSPAGDRLNLVHGRERDQFGRPLIARDQEHDITSGMRGNNDCSEGDVNGSVELPRVAGARPKRRAALQARSRLAQLARTNSM